MSDLFADSHRLIPLAVAGASLAGSLHCVSMCGPLVTAATRGPLPAAAYQLGRLIAYVLLGALAGVFGQRVFDPSIDGIYLEITQWLAALGVTSAFLILAYRTWRGKGAHLWVMPAFISRMYARLLPRSAAAESTPSVGGIGRAALIGALSGFLPCGWLHSFVLAAVTTRSGLTGAGLMALFWLGSVPAMTAAPVLVHQLLGPLARRAPRFTAVLLLAAGLMSLGMKVSASPRFSGAAKSACNCHHH